MRAQNEKGRFIHFDTFLVVSHIGMRDRLPSSVFDPCERELVTPTCNSQPKRLVMIFNQPHGGGSFDLIRNLVLKNRDLVLRVVLDSGRGRPLAVAF